MAAQKNNADKTMIIHDKEMIKSLDCSNPLVFQNVILKIRKFDDTIINILNAEIPTESFYKKSDAQLPIKKCQQFRQEMHDYYDSREEAVKRCIERSKKEIEALKEQQQKDASSSSSSFGILREKNYNLRVYQQELEIEKICRTRTQKAVEERCRTYV